jgi:hypothetical protein
MRLNYFLKIALMFAMASTLHGNPFSRKSKNRASKINTKTADSARPA